MATDCGGVKFQSTVKKIDVTKTPKKQSSSNNTKSTKKPKK